VVIVVGSTTRGPLRRIVPGSVAERLLSGAGCPVAVAPHGYGDAERAAPAVVGVAFDDSEESRLALEGGRELARRAGVALRIITVVQRLAFGAVATSADAPGESANVAIQRGLRGAHEAAVDAQRDLVDVEGVFVAGHPADVLAQQSRELGLLVAGSRGYGPIGAVLLGGTTHTLLRSAECPLLIMPRGRGLQLDDTA